jgi:uncharacterized protein (DUF433 family)
MGRLNKLFETPIYGMVDAAHYLRIPYQTLRYWTLGRNSVAPIVNLPSTDPPRLSFVNLLECHMLSSMRRKYNLRLPKVRKALRTLAEMYPSPHPLVDKPLETDTVDVFIREHGGGLLNLNRPDQRSFKEILNLYLQRIERGEKGMLSFFPFVEKASVGEPKIIMINPGISFGRPVIAGTGIPTAVIASRFHARDSVSELAKEYGRTEGEIEEAIRWETRAIAA